jgi:hypothetical protein
MPEISSKKMHGPQKEVGLGRLRMGAIHLLSKTRFNGGTALQI